MVLPILDYLLCAYLQGRNTAICANLVLMFLKVHVQIYQVKTSQFLHYRKMNQKMIVLMAGKLQNH